MLRSLTLIFSLACLLPVGAIAQSIQPSGGSAVNSSGGSFPVMTVTKTATCGCCRAWMQRAQQAGFQIEFADVSQENLSALKDRLGIGKPLRACHTTQIGGYFIEGHVPLEDVARLVTTRHMAGAHVRGLAVPGMPLGSPGMDMGWRKQPYDTVLIVQGQPDQIYASHNK